MMTLYNTARKRDYVELCRWANTPEETISRRLLLMIGLADIEAKKNQDISDMPMNEALSTVVEVAIDMEIPSEVAVMDYLDYKSIIDHMRNAS